MKFTVKVGADRYEIEAPTKYDARLKAIRSHIKKYPAQFHNEYEVAGKLNVEVQEAGPAS